MEIQFIAKSQSQDHGVVVNGWFKYFNILREWLCHNIDKHGQVLRAIAIVTNIAMQNGSLTFHVHGCLIKVLQITLDEYYSVLIQAFENMIFMVYTNLVFALGDVGLHG